jgi:hypothetical protein
VYYTLMRMVGAARQVSAKESAGLGSTASQGPEAAPASA